MIHEVNWMRSSVPVLAELEAPLRNMLEDCWKGTKLTRRVSDRRVGADEGYWTADRVMACERVRMYVAQAVTAHH